MRQIVTLSIAFILLFAVTGTAQESLMNEYINTFEGRWVCDAPAVQDIDGYWKKGEDIQPQQ